MAELDRRKEFSQFLRDEWERLGPNESVRGILFALKTVLADPRAKTLEPLAIAASASMGTHAGREGLA